MAAQFFSLVVPTGTLPKPDTSWISNLSNTIGGAIDEAGTQKSFNTLADRIKGSQAAGPQPASFLNGLVGGSSPTVAAAPSGIAPVTPVQRGPAQGSTFQPFIDTVKTKITNPYGLAAVAATGQAESGWSPQNANRNWDDPSQSGASGKAGGILSWRNERLQGLYNYAAQKGEQPGNISPQTQAEYFLQEDPNLVAALNQAKSPEEAANLMANAWKFAGYNSSGGEAARRRALAVNYAANDFKGAPAAASEVASLDPSIGIPMPGAAGQMRASDPAQVVSAPPPQAAPQMAGGSTSGSPALAAPQQPQGQPQSNILAAGVTPVTRGSVDPSLIQFMLRDRNLRDVGLKLWAANVQGQNPAEAWQFINLPDGTLARANQQTGAVERIGQFAKPRDPQGLVNAGDGQLYDPNTGKWISSPNAGQQFRRATPEEAAQYGATAGQFGPDGRFYPNNPPSGFNVTTNPDGTVSVTQGQQGNVPKLTEQQSKDLVYYQRGSGALKTLDPISNELTSAWGAGANMVPGGNYLKSAEYQQAEQAGKEFLQAILRKDTGAAITKEEERQYGDVYLPRPGDSAEVLLQKKEARSRALDAIRNGLGPAQILAGERPGNGNAADLEAAKQAIAKGAPRDAVIKRLRDAGIDPEGL